MPPDPILALIAIVGLLFYSSIAVAIAKTGDQTRHLYASDLRPMRIATTVTTVMAVGAWTAWAAVTTAGLGPPSTGSACALFVGGFVVIPTVALLTWAPSPSDQRKYFAAIWPIAFLASGLGAVGIFIGRNLAKVPNSIGTYIADSVNESKEIAA